MNLPLRLALRVRGSGDVALAIVALSVVALLFAPAPPWLLDLCLAANLALAATLLVAALFARDALRLASLPTLLLLTTLFRLALEVSSTRLILARGEAGRVIQAFGQVVVAGNYVVGAVVFAILTLVQLLVVAKGAERVAEVAARFTLDALPGKQMSIDADLRAGAIEQAEARRRRRALEREGQLYGAMDGALKFVKGDALAGVVIVLVNVAGGLVAGIARGMSVEAAARRFALLAIGDGLVAQIPALLVSLAAGVAVTRVAAEDEGASLSEDLGRQLFGDARALAAVGGLCTALAFLPGLPAAPFLALAGAAVSGAVHRARRGTAPPAASADGSSAPTRPAPFAPPAPLTLELAPDLDALGGVGGRLVQDIVPAVVERLWRELGVRAPPLEVRTGPLPDGAWRLLVDEVPAGAGRAAVGEAVSLAPAADLAAVGIEGAPDPDPLTGKLLTRIVAEDRERAEALAPVRGALERVGAGLLAALRSSAHLLVGVQEVQALLDGLERSYPALVREATRQLAPPLVAEVLRRLLEEGVSIRPLRAIVEAMLEAGGATRGAPALAESCRRALRRHIADQHRTDHGVIDALLLDPALESSLHEALGPAGAALDPTAASELLADLERALSTHTSSRPVLLAPPEIRRSIRNLVAPRFPRLPVLSYDDLPAEMAIRPVGKVAPARAATA